ncbi:hypothetical protein CAPTEDRAFT_185966 [Capitella teleta]|uniref:G-protein coupled receptors family 1 profile domain-containing protein n=1 Tax=Capitella teleta TaxID=283909 RepID=R7VLP0_CAPTE|nr:hypothetical protein CAPTEDRAFT_185966 [Capitella teleta]|eukprot:ELU17760.1 hypothetical protein CAPTEDRAFT_185966 [Capitella teleta]
MEAVTSSAYNVTEYVVQKTNGRIPMGALVVGLTSAAGSLLANLLTITAIISSRLNKHSTHILVANQSGCDILVAVNTIATYTRVIYSHLLPFWLSNILRLGNSVTIHTVIVISLGNSLLIGVDRFIATVRPFKYKSMVTKKRIYCTIGLMWFVVISILMLPLTIHNRNRNLNTWAINLGDLSKIYPSGFPAFVGFLMISLIATNSILYFAILVAFQQVSGRVESSNETGKKSRKLTSTVAIVVIFTLAFYCPYIVFLIMPPTVGNPSFTQYVLPHLAIVLITVGSYMNNIIYPLRQPDYRKAYLAVLGCKMSLSQIGPASNLSTGQ